MITPGWCPSRNANILIGLRNCKGRGLRTAANGDLMETQETDVPTDRRQRRRGDAKGPQRTGQSVRGLRRAQGQTRLLCRDAMQVLTEGSDRWRSGIEDGRRLSILPMRENSSSNRLSQRKYDRVRPARRIGAASGLGPARNARRRARAAGIRLPAPVHRQVDVSPPGDSTRHPDPRSTFDPLACV